MIPQSLTVQEFYRTNSANGVLTRWMLEKDVDDFLGIKITGGIILADALVGDGMRDHISPDLFNAFHDLMGDKAATIDQVRSILVEKLMMGDATVAGLINTIKGRVGEHVFLETAQGAGFLAHLSESKNQEAWDCCVINASGEAQYVQVKTYGDADAVLEHMKTVADKVAQGKITDGDKVVDAISFAVPQDIHAAVVEKAQAAGLDSHVWAFDLSAQDAARIVQQGFDNVAYLGLGNFFNQLAGGTLTVAVMHTLAQAFLLRKSASHEMAQTVALETGISAGGIGASLGMEGVVNGLGFASKSIPTVAVLLATGLTARGLLRRMIARHDYLGFLKQENALLRQKHISLLPKT